MGLTWAAGLLPAALFVIGIAAAVRFLDWLAR